MGHIDHWRRRVDAARAARRVRSSSQAVAPVIAAATVIADGSRAFVFRDAEAIAEAATRPMRFVTLKSQERLDMQSLHRARDRLVEERTSPMNQLRALLLERGIVIAQGCARLRLRTESLLAAEECTLSARIRHLIGDMVRRRAELDERIAAFDAEFAAEARHDAAAIRLTSTPGIGGLNATALVAAVGDARTFSRGRDLAAWLGLVPRQMTTGGKPPARHHQARQQIPAQDADPGVRERHCRR